jgi:hypothetical protein
VPRYQTFYKPRLSLSRREADRQPRAVTISPKSRKCSRTSAQAGDRSSLRQYVQDDLLRKVVS